jgi:hypothetical protein
MRAGLPELHGLTAGTGAGESTQEAPASLAARTSAREPAAPLAASQRQGFEATGRRAGAGGLPGYLASFTDCDAPIPQAIAEAKSKTKVARIFPGTAYILSSPARTRNSRQAVRRSLLPGGHQPDAPERTLHPQSVAIRQRRRTGEEFTSNVSRTILSAG